MVLKAVAVALGLVTLAAPSLALAYNASAFDQATALSRKGKSAAALALLQKSYTFSSPDLPEQVSAFAASTALSLKDWSLAESIADNALRAHWSGWPPTDANAPGVDKRLKGSNKAFVSLLNIAAKAKSKLFVIAGEDVPETQRQKLKDETKLYTDILATLGPDGEKAQSYWTAVQEQEERAVKEKYKMNLSFNVSYSTWEDRPYFDSRVTARAVFYSPCAGLALNYLNSFYEWSGGACFGQGVGAVQFGNGAFDTHGKATLIAGYASALVQLSERSAFGLEGNLMNLTMSASSTVGQKTVATASEFGALLVGRFRFSGVEVKFKGGPNFNLPSAIWAVELGFPLYHFF